MYLHSFHVAGQLFGQSKSRQLCRNKNLNNYLQIDLWMAWSPTNLIDCFYKCWKLLFDMWFQVCFLAVVECPLDQNISNDMIDISNMCACPASNSSHPYTLPVCDRFFIKCSQHTFMYPSNCVKQYFCGSYEHNLDPCDRSKLTWTKEEYAGQWAHGPISPEYTDVMFPQHNLGANCRGNIALLPYTTPTLTTPDLDKCFGRSLCSQLRLWMKISELGMILQGYSCSGTPH